jgi:hypothetical protein
MKRRNMTRPRPPKGLSSHKIKKRKKKRRAIGNATYYLYQNISSSFAARESNYRTPWLRWEPKSKVVAKCKHVVDSTAFLSTCFCRTNICLISVFRRGVNEIFALLGFYAS